MSKYHAKKVVVDGITFDSKREARRYGELSLLLRAGEISELELQKRYELTPDMYEIEVRYGKRGQRLKDKRICVERASYYVADFVYKDKNGDLVVEDVKGVRTREYILKRKWMLYRYGIRIREV